VSSKAPAVLVLRALGLGDLLTGVPAIRAVRRAFPGHELVLATPSSLAPLVSAIGGVDRLLPTPAYVREPPSTVDWPGAPPAVAVNLHGRGPQSHEALRALRPGRLLGLDLDGPQWTDEEHEVHRWCRMLRAYGIAADPTDLDLGPPLEARHVVVHPGASSAERCWPVDRYAAVARALTDDGHRVLFTGGPDERERAFAVALGAGLAPEAVLAGRTDVDGLAALVRHAALVICGDTGVAHLATAYRVPSVVLFGPMDPARWGPPPQRPWHRALWHGPRGLDAIGVPEVLAAAGEVRRRAAATR
jgi:ADP-heptose:LPS heptosyltransferase